ncbi:DsbA family protein [Flavobacterium sp. P21]|uniref:DsbA family protein n=1 Tax=Flavobacterium sp. P21 TaxID=3423948 RepID=UPI003D67EF6F
MSFQESSETISLKSIILFGFVFFATVCIWELLKATLLKQKELKEFQLTGNRFMRNYEIFKNTLISKDWVDLPNSSIILGNKESKTEITIITNPFCGHCGKAHKNLDKILTANKDSLKIKILINVDLDTLDDGSKAFLRSLMFIYFEKGNDIFVQALSYWFETRNLVDWAKEYSGQSFDSDKIDSIYKQQNLWCKTNDFNFTPAIFINGYLYPKTYNRENLKFFINEIIEDDFFEVNQIEEKAIIETI